MKLMGTPSSNSNEVTLETNAFTRMRRLRLLHLSHVQLNGCYEEFPNGLRWLCWVEFPLESMAIDFPLQSLVVLEMQYSSLRQFWKGTKCLPSLKTLDLSHSHDLTETGDFSLVPNLERLILVGCASLVAIHESIGKLEKLVYLNMTDCKVIRKLPDNITTLKFLETLIISGCSNLNEFPMEMSKMESLKVLQAESIVINQLQITVTATATGMGPGKSLNNYWICLPSTLVDLSLTNCNLSDDDFPRDFGNVPSLKKLDLGDNAICSLPDCIRGLKGLDYLGVSSCRSLKSLIRLPRVRELETIGCESLEKVTFQSLSCLPEGIDLYFDGPSQIVEIEHWYKLEAIGRVDVEMINLLGLYNMEPMEPIRMATATSETTTIEIQGLYEYGIFSTFLPGTVNEIPGEFSHSTSGEFSISFTVPLLSNHKIRGLNIYCVYANNSFESPWAILPPVIIIVRNKSKRLKWIYWPSCYGIPSMEQDVIWLSHWKLGNQLEAGDQVTASVYLMDSSFEVKEWGIRIVHEEEDKMIRQLHNSCGRDANCYDVQDPDNGEVIGIGGGLSELYQVMPGTYVFCGGPMKKNREHFDFWIKILNRIGEYGEEIEKEERQQQQHHVESDLTPASDAEVEAERVCIGCKFFIMAVVQWSRALFSPTERMDRP